MGLRGLNGVAGGYLGLQGDTWDYKGSNGLKGFIRGYMGLQRVTWGYSGLQAVTRNYIG